MVQIRLIDTELGRHDPDANPPEIHAKIVPALEAIGMDPFVPNGSVIDVPEEVAGVRPHWRSPQDGDDLRYLADVGYLSHHGNGSVKGVYDLGRGLLAQTDVWELVSDNGSEGAES
jgi:hypothetical protein